MIQEFLQILYEAGLITTVIIFIGFVLGSIWGVAVKTKNWIVGGKKK
jgi:hypothetical protein